MPSQVTTAQLAQKSGAALEGDPNLLLDGIAPLESAGPSQLAFLANPKYSPQLKTTKAGAVFVYPSVVREERAPTLLRVGNPYLAFARAASIFDTRPHPQPGIHPTAVVDPTARLGRDVSIGPLCVIGQRSVVGDRSVLRALVSVGEEVVIGADCQLHSHVSIRERCVLGDRVIVQNGAQIGGDGYGFVPNEGRHEKIPQIGNVVIGDDVEIGALCSIDRAMMASTLIGEGTKLDDMVMIGHNVRVGRHCLLVAQVGISGSTTLGDYVILGGQTGLAGHITLGDGVRVAAKSGVAKSVKPGSTLAGIPTVPHKEWLRRQALLGQLERMRQELSDLRKRVDAMKGESS